MVTESNLPDVLNTSEKFTETSVDVETASTSIRESLNNCVLSQGKVCICNCCETNRDNLLKKRKHSQEYIISAHSQKVKQVRTNSQSNELSLCQPEIISGSESEEEKIEKMTSACRTILQCIGEDPNREGLLKTPSRWAKALLFMTKGYKQKTLDVLNGAIFCQDSHKEMVVVKDIDIHSLCEHHMVPFTGRIHVGYIPNGRILGISKIVRIAEVFSRRLQVQERLTTQIADAIDEAVSPLGVAVVIECSHFCMIMRGVQKSGAKTVTSSVKGCFEKDSKTRSEFFSIIHRN